MKVGSSPNYVVRVTKPGWYEKPEQAPLYEGIYHFDLNHVAGISFVPRVTAAGPPWSPDGLPDDAADFTTAEHVRVCEVLSGGYSVTPDDERAGKVEQLPYMFEWPPRAFRLSSGEKVRVTAYKIRVLGGRPRRSRRRGRAARGPARP